jgi:hypothetical protein
MQQSMRQRRRCCTDRRARGIRKCCGRFGLRINCMGAHATNATKSRERNAQAEGMAGLARRRGRGCCKKGWCNLVEDGAGTTIAIVRRAGPLLPDAAHSNAGRACGIGQGPIT